MKVRYDTHSLPDHKLRFRFESPYFDSLLGKSGSGARRSSQVIDQSGEAEMVSQTELNFPSESSSSALAIIKTISSIEWIPSLQTTLRRLTWQFYHDVTCPAQKYVLTGSTKEAYLRLDGEISDVKESKEICDAPWKLPIYLETVGKFGQYTSLEKVPW